MDFQNEMNRLQEMLNLRNLNQDPPIDLYDLKGRDEGDNMIDSLTIEPSDILLLGDEVINTTPERENDKFIKSSVDDLVPIPRESEVTSVYDDLECDVPITIQFPTTDVREENFDINSSLGEYVVDFLMENVDATGLPRHLDNPLFDEEFEDISSLDPPELTLVIDEPTLLDTLPLPLTFFDELTVKFGLDDSIPTEIDDRYHDSEGDILYFEQLLNKDTSSDVSPILLPTESSSLDLPLPNPKQICLREVERFDPFSLTQLGRGKSRG
ncbi:hypothetical protein Tco_0291255 [Tanacetum coccineum]